MKEELLVTLYEKPTNSQTREIFSYNLPIFTKHQYLTLHKRLDHTNKQI